MPEAGARKRLLIVGLGGLGCPALSVLARANEVELWLCDDDVVELSNLHRQTLYRDADVGRDKLDAAQQALIASGVAPERLVPVRSRLLPENARQLIGQVDLVLEGADNYATKFLAADAAHLEARPIIHGAAVRWVATAWAVAATGGPCYRCLFEDLPPEGVGPSCAEAGVLGPVPGVIGALQGAEAVRLLRGETPAFTGRLIQYDSGPMSFRTIRFNPNPSCAVCGTAPHIVELDPARYPAPSCN